MVREVFQMSKPQIKLVGEDGNAFSILGRAGVSVKRFNRTCNECDLVDWEQVKAEATSGDYDNLLQTMMKYFDCDSEDYNEEDDY